MFIYKACWCSCALLKCCNRAVLITEKISCWVLGQHHAVITPYWRLLSITFTTMSKQSFIQHPVNRCQLDAVFVVAQTPEVRTTASHVSKRLSSCSTFANCFPTNNKTYIILEDNIWNLTIWFRSPNLYSIGFIELYRKFFDFQFLIFLQILQKGHC